ncbi:hypothetical protein Cni_G25936 [Canna indica]|uniref:Homeobox-leucine zipper protein n=1 Tax=Canna indica TaxID=4628 RepID=A0AAQ3L578_9LILI|nr:hypothetical protein Cni_G25936 [Canna indica]
MTYNGMLPFFPANLLLQNSDHEEDQSHHHQSINPQGGMEMAASAGKRTMSFSGIEENVSDDDFLASSSTTAPGERKRKLSLEQIRVLEKSFEMGSKLEPERKMELARTLGLQPRQIAIWFQNRRARWKTKQMEKEYDELKKNFVITKRENDALQAQNKKLLSELLSLKGKETSEPINLNKETEGSCSMRSENSSDINLDISRASINGNNSEHHHHQMSRIMFPSYRAPSFPPIHHSSSSEKVEHSTTQEGNFCNILCSSDDQSAFWAWSGHHKFHH